MMEPKIKVLIVEDSVVMCRVLQRILSNDSEIEVVGIARCCEDAFSSAKELKPDVILIDVEIPLVNGKSCLADLMAQGSYAVIVLSTVSPEQANDTIESLEIGAFDFIKKPGSTFEMSSTGRQEEVINKVKMAYESLQRPHKLNKKAKCPLIKHPDKIKDPVKMEYIIAVGISTGGPRSLSKIIPLFPADIPAAIVVVQHMPPSFTASLARRLNDNSSLIVKEATDMEELKPGHVYIAPGDYHLTFKKSGNKVIIRLNQAPPILGLRPSADVMMESLAKTDFDSNIGVVGVVMTGMGSDGTKGLKSLKEKKKAYVIAQDEETSIVYGMPRSAIGQGLVDAVVPLQDIPTCIMNYMGVRG